MDDADRDPAPASDEPGGQSAEDDEDAICPADSDPDHTRDGSRWDDSTGDADGVTSRSNASGTAADESHEATFGGSILSPLKRAASSDSELLLFLREIVVSVLIVAVIGLLLFSISGVWPPMVAVESGSMEPHLSKGDLVFVMEEHRLSPPFAVDETGIVTKDLGETHGYDRFGDSGDVIVYLPYGTDGRTPVIHRAHFWVNESENWYSKADPEYIEADSCMELPHCPADHAGFITKGDNAVSNDYYDQADGISSPVKPDWIRGRATLRIPYLGWIRLAVSDTTVPGVNSAFATMGNTGVPAPG